MKTKLIALLAALVAVSVQAGEHPSCKFTVKVTGTDTGRITYNQDGDVLPLVDGVDAVVWDHQKVSLGGGGCVTGSEPVVTFTAWVWAIAQSGPPGWCKVDEDSYTLYQGCEGLTVYSVQTCSEELIQVRLEVDNVYCPCRSTPAFTSNPEDPYDWIVQPSANFSGNLEIGSQSWLGGLPKIHVQVIQYNDTVDFEDIANYSLKYDEVLSPDEGAFDTSLLDYQQTWTRARFEDSLGNGLTSWTEAYVLNPLP